MKKLAIGKQNFDELIKKEIVYVDKTEYIHKLIENDEQCFLSRPRRFGKTLLISTLLNLFQGNKELFKGTFIYDKHQFEKFPIIKINFNAIDFIKQSLDIAIKNELNKIFKEYEIKSEKNTIKDKFRELIEKLREKYNKRVVILIDEYDKPITDFLNKKEIALDNQESLKNFYGILKAMEGDIKFLLITGVSKFSKVSIFSDLNHLNDISQNRDFSTICGFTFKELNKNFSKYLTDTADELEINEKELYKQLKFYYNGYSFDGRSYIYNPFSILNFFYNKEFNNYWFKTGTPTFLINMAKTQKYDFLENKELLVDNNFFDKFDIEKIGFDVIMFQTGYLTIKIFTNEKVSFIDRSFIT